LLVSRYFLTLSIGRQLCQDRYQVDYVPVPCFKDKFVQMLLFYVWKCLLNMLNLFYTVHNRTCISIVSRRIGKTCVSSFIQFFVSYK